MKHLQPAEIQLKRTALPLVKLLVNDLPTWPTLAPTLAFKPPSGAPRKLLVKRYGEATCRGKTAGKTVRAPFLFTFSPFLRTRKRRGAHRVLGQRRVIFRVARAGLNLFSSPSAQLYNSL